MRSRLLKDSSLVRSVRSILATVTGLPYWFASQMTVRRNAEPFAAETLPFEHYEVQDILNRDWMANLFH